MTTTEFIEYPTRKDLFKSLPGVAAEEGVLALDIVDLGRTLRVTREGGEDAEQAGDDTAENEKAGAEDDSSQDGGDAGADDESEKEPADDSDPEVDDDLLGDKPDLEGMDRDELVAYVEENKLDVEIHPQTPVKTIRKRIVEAQG